MVLTNLEIKLKQTDSATNYFLKYLLFADDHKICQNEIVSNPPTSASPPFTPNPPVKKPGPRSSSKGEDGTASHESKPDAFLSSSFWWSYSHIPGEWFLTWWFLKKSCFGHSWFAYIQISENSSSHVLPEKKPRGTFHSTQ